MINSAVQPAVEPATEAAITPATDRAVREGEAPTHDDVAEMAPAITDSEAANPADEVRSLQGPVANVPLPFLLSPNVAVDQAVTIPRMKGAKQNLNGVPDTNVTADDTEIVSQLITDTLTLISGGNPVTKPCVRVKVKAGLQIAKLRQNHFDTWGAIGANVSELRARAKLGGVESFDSICRRLGLPRTKCNRLADCHDRLVALPEAYQQALRELRKTATADVVEKVNQVMAEGVSQKQIKKSLSIKFSKNGRQKSRTEVAKVKFLSTLCSLKTLDERRIYLKAVMEEATRTVGWTFGEQNSVVFY